MITEGVSMGPIYVFGRPSTRMPPRFRTVGSLPPAKPGDATGGDGDTHGPRTVARRWSFFTSFKT